MQNLILMFASYGPLHVPTLTMSTRTGAKSSVYAPSLPIIFLSLNILSGHALDQSVEKVQPGGHRRGEAVHQEDGEQRLSAHARM